MIVSSRRGNASHFAAYYSWNLEIRNNFSISVWKYSFASFLFWVRLNFCEKVRSRIFVTFFSFMDFDFLFLWKNQRCRRELFREVGFFFLFFFFSMKLSSRRCFRAYGRKFLDCCFFFFFISLSVIARTGRSVIRAIEFRHDKV